jgi:pimeloyl-ACP methyl ester carboxylesterase
MASAEDMLYPHLDRLPALKDGQRIERLAYDPGAKHAAIVGFARELPQGSSDPIAPVRTPAGHDPAVQFVDAAQGQVFVRCYGDPAAPPLILLHDAPGSGLAPDGVARTLAQTHYVLLPDLPGNGESDDPAVADGNDFLAACADGVIAIIAELGLARVTIAALGCGCAVAALLAREAGIAGIVLENPPIADPAIAARIAPDLPMTPEGSHWITAWLMVRDGQIYDPWYAGTIASQRRTQGNFDADWLHAQTCEIMKARTSYHRLPRAAWAGDVAAALAEAKVPVRHAPILELALSGALS